MATFYVDGASGSDTNDGSESNPWKTIRRATQTTGTYKVASGDTVRIAPGLYREAGIYGNTLTIATANTTWRVDGDGSDPVIIDGGWGPSNMTNDNRITTAAPGSINTPLLRVQADGVVLDGIAKYGIVVSNSPGRGVQLIDADDVEIRYLKTDWSYGSSANVENADNSVWEDCAFLRQGMINYWSGAQKGVRGGGFTTKRADATVIRRCVFLFTGGETVDIDIFSTNTVIEDSEFGPGRHPKLYNIGSQGTIIRRNLLWDDHSFTDEMQASQVAIAVADERARVGNSGADPSDNIQIYNNVVITPRRGIGISGGQNMPWSSTRIYIGYNTVICSDDTLLGVYSMKSYEGRHTGLVENNLVYSLTGQAPNNSLGRNDEAPTASKPNGVVFRNNAWGGTPHSTAQSGTDLTGNSVLRLVKRDYIIPPLGVKLNQTEMPVFTFRDEIETLGVGKPLASSSVVDAAATGSATGSGSTTPPTITTDFYGNSRNSAPDVGAIQHGDGDPPGGTLAASFSQDETSGTTPLTVTFTDTSTSSDGTINYRLWDFGDGTQATSGSPVVKTYGTPGIYTPSLVVRDTTGLEDDATGSAITVSAAAPPGEAGAYDIKAFDLPTSTGDFDVEFDNLDEGETIQAVIVLYSKGTTANTPASGGLLGWGMATETQQVAFFGASDDNMATANTGARMATDAVILSGTASYAVNGKASFVGFSGNTATFNVSDAFPAAYKAVAIAICNPADLKLITLGNNGTTATHAAPFVSKAVLLTGNFAPTAGGANNDICWGASADSNQVVTSWRDLDAASEANVAAYSATGQVARKYHGIFADILGEVGENTAYRVTGGNMNETLASLAFGTPNATAGQVMLPADETGYSFDTGNAPALLLLWGSLNNESGAISYGGGTNDAFWACAVTENSTGGVVMASEDNADPTNTFGLTTDKLKLYDGDGSTVVVEGDIALTASGFALDLSTAAPKDLIINYLSLPKPSGPPVGEPVLGYEVWPRQVDAGDDLTFTDLTFENGATIISRIVDWGDGEQTLLGEATTATHHYTSAGDYSVTLIVTLDDGREFRMPRAGMINVKGDLAEWRIEAIRPHPDGITLDGITKLYEDPRTDGADYGYFTIGLNLRGIPINQAPDPVPGPMPGKLVIYSDATTGGLGVVRPDGKRAALALTWEGGGDTGGGTSLATPTGFTVPATDADGDFTISWNSVNGATSYIIQEVNLSSGLRELTTTSTSYAITGRGTGNWLYRVAARKTEGDATISSSYTAQQTCEVGGSGGGTVERSIAVGSDDAWQGSGTFVSTTYNNHVVDATDERVGLRFTNITVPQGATIDSAVLEVFIVNNYDDPNLSIKGEDIDDAPTFTSDSNNIGARTLTTASVTWSASNLGNAVTVESPDIKTVIQEIVDRAGWESGNALVLVLTANSGCSFGFAGYENSSSYPVPKLTVEYS